MSRSRPARPVEAKSLRSSCGAIATVAADDVAVVAVHSRPRRLQPCLARVVRPEKPARPRSRQRLANPQRLLPLAPRPPAPHETRKSKGAVVLSIGLPGSGKSTWFKRHNILPLSSDMVRILLFDDVTEQRYQDLVFSTLRSMLRGRLLARRPWNYVDATNLSPHERRSWIKLAHDFGYEAHAVFFDVPPEVCIERNRRRERNVPEDVMQRMAAKLRPPKFEEGFAKITVVRLRKKDGENAAARRASARVPKPSLTKPNHPTWRIPSTKSVAEIYNREERPTGRFFLQAENTLRHSDRLKPSRTRNTSLCYHRREPRHRRGSQSVSSLPGGS